MSPKEPTFSFSARAAEKAAARERDEEKLASGETTRAEMAKINGGSIRGVQYKGPAMRIRSIVDPKS